MNFHTASFKAAYGTSAQLPASTGPEVSFAGRSNVGKSSLLNKLMYRKGLAKVSSTPGKTATINFYDVDGRDLVDLPGYGYAKVSKAERDRWGQLMEDYFASGLITLGVMIVDARHKPTGDDVTMAKWFSDTGCPVVVVANKLDKLKRSEIDPNMQLIRQTLSLRAEDELVPFSAERGNGKERLLGLLSGTAE